MKLGAFCVGALVLLAAANATADNSEKVTLRDDSVFVGELVEKVPGNHITIRLATGEVRRIEWAAIAEQPAQLNQPNYQTAGALPTAQSVPILAGQLTVSVSIQIAYDIS